MKKSYHLVNRLIFVLSFLSLINLYGQVINGSFDFGGITRNYIVFLPQNFQPNMPVVLTLHGYGDNVDMIKNYASIHELGADSGFITVYPAAIASQWNTGNVPTATEDDPGFISALIDTLKENYEIDLERV